MSYNSIHTLLCNLYHHSFESNLFQIEGRYSHMKFVRYLNMYCLGTEFDLQNQLDNSFQLNKLLPQRRVRSNMNQLDIVLEVVIQVGNMNQMDMVLEVVIQMGKNTPVDME